jgi:hypothetical protein
MCAALRVVATGTRDATRSRMRIILLGLLAACSEGIAETKPSAIGLGDCETVDEGVRAGAGWRNEFIPQTSGLAYFNFFATPSNPGGGPIDAVLGLSNGPADSFGDLGPIVRFNPQGFVDARNGSSYQAVQAFPYQADGRLYDFALTVHTDTRTYDVVVWQDGMAETSREIAKDFAFRTEQSGMSRIDSVARIIDSSSGSLALCDFRAEPRDTGMLSETGSGWNSTAFPPQADRFRADFFAHAGFDMDVVIGLAHAPPEYFSDLAAIVRFNPAGYFDARDGGAYRYDELHRWEGGQRYHFIFDVDVEAKRYSVYVEGWNELLTIAKDYAFRDEQSGVTSLGSLAQIVDSEHGYVYSELLRVAY